MATINSSKFNPAQTACFWIYQYTVAEYSAASPSIWQEMSSLKLIDSKGNPRNLATEDWTKDRFSLMKPEGLRKAAEKLSRTKQKITSIANQLKTICTSLDRATDFLDDMISTRFSIPLIKDQVSTWGNDLLDKEDLIKMYLNHLESCLDRIKKLEKILSDIKETEKEEDSPSGSEKHSICSLNRMIFPPSDSEEEKSSTPSQRALYCSLHELPKREDSREKESAEPINSHASSHSDLMELETVLSGKKSQEKAKSSPSNLNEHTIRSLDAINLSIFDRKEEELHVAPGRTLCRSLDEMLKEEDLSENKEAASSSRFTNSDPLLNSKHKHKRRYLYNFLNP